MAAHAKQRLSGVEKASSTQQDDSSVDDGDEVSSAAMQTTLTLLLRYQRLLVSRFIADDQLQNISADLSLSGIAHVAAK